MDRREIYHRTLEYFFAPVADYLFRDPGVTEVLINGPDAVYIERAGQLHKTDRRFASAADLERAAVNLAEFVGRPLNAKRSSLEARLPEPYQFRAHVMLPPASRQGIHISLRKFRTGGFTRAELIAHDTLTPEAADYLDAAIRDHKNLLISGGTSTGKTTLLNTLAEAIPAEDRIIVIEDTSEIRLPQPHVVYLEAQAEITIRDLFVDALRMRPERIIVGEVRRGEALDLVQSMLSGHDGTLSTIHASTPALALTRLETLCLMSDTKLPVVAARRQVASAIQLVVQVARQKGRRRITEIAEVRGLRRSRYRVRPVFRQNGDGTLAREAQI